MGKEDASILYDLIQEHYEYTSSGRAKAIIENWSEYVNKFKKVIPPAYKEILEQKKKMSKIKEV